MEVVPNTANSDAFYKITQNRFEQIVSRLNSVDWFMHKPLGMPSILHNIW